MEQARRRKLAVVNGERVRFVAAMSRIVVHAEPTPFALEGPLIAGFRARLLLGGRGWSWKMADTASRDLVHEVLRLAGAKRPSWLEGQPDYAQGVSFTIRTRCARCGARLAGDQRKFCGPLCATAFHTDLCAQRLAAEAAIIAEGLDAP